MILSGQSLGVNVARAVAGHLERMSVDVVAIVALDPRSTPRSLLQQLQDFHPAVTNSSDSRRLLARQLTCISPFVPC